MSTSSSNVMKKLAAQKMPKTNENKETYEKSRSTEYFFYFYAARKCAGAL